MDIDIHVSGGALRHPLVLWAHICISVRHRLITMADNSSLRPLCAASSTFAFERGCNPTRALLSSDYALTRKRQARAGPSSLLLFIPPVPLSPHREGQREQGMSAAPAAALLMSGSAMVEDGEKGHWECHRSCSRSRCRRTRAAARAECIRAKENLREGFSPLSSFCIIPSPFFSFPAHSPSSLPPIGIHHPSIAPAFGRTFCALDYLSRYIPLIWTSHVSSSAARTSSAHPKDQHLSASSSSHYTGYAAHSHPAVIELNTLPRFPVDTMFPGEAQRECGGHAGGIACCFIVLKCYRPPLFAHHFLVVSRSLPFRFFPACITQASRQRIQQNSARVNGDQCSLALVILHAL
ncbi:hypothetical protein B0H13DRAFT_2390165 [Mycena leptocephala]|nr:hypothetical protein B0H13DRAFT_2390165 [Mycena leptocephala]